MYVSFCTPRLSAVRTLVMALLLLACSAPLALADSYQLTTVVNSSLGTVYGIDGAGDFTLNRGQKQICGTAVNASSCFETFYAGNNTPTYSSAAPSLHWDNGWSCSPAIPGFAITGGVCNGNHFLAAGTYASSGTAVLRGIWAGPNPDPRLSLLSHGSFDGGSMNSSGDAIFFDALDNSFVFAQDLSTTVTPEPASILLLSTGGLSLFAAARRRLSR